MIYKHMATNDVQLTNWYVML